MKSTINVLLFLCSTFLFLSCIGYGEKLTFNGTEVYYKDGIERSEAEALGNYLVESEFADGNTKSVQLVKNEENGHYLFRMVTQEKAQQDETYEILFKALAMQVSSEVFDGKPVDFDVCNNRFESVKYIPFDE
jgi:hypothetical protein